ncbi:DUF4136 domain-containing protein [Photobacterium sp.]|uniref:DUF4136 domain-containing protein n=1 Tax=Photobacterium sp. TaxID=660 RepID=UPI00299D8400|nr:DUF4136 domain-containing protein [Photobacterium sp.]MDX1301547.1 DUF4136 domain-containing protein [Photobacterium sp.]
MANLFRSACLSLLLAGCSTDVSTDYNSQVDYSQFNTYLFAAPPSQTAVSLDATRVEEAIATQLAMKGLRHASETNADLTIKHYIQKQSDFESYGTSVGFGYASRNVGIGFSSPTRYKEYNYGKLIVELIENSSNQVVWRAVSQRKLTETMTPSSRIEFIDKQISEMFKQYPPQ